MTDEPLDAPIPTPEPTEAPAPTPEPTIEPPAPTEAPIESTVVVIPPAGTQAHDDFHDKLEAFLHAVERDAEEIIAWFKLHA